MNKTTGKTTSVLEQSKSLQDKLVSLRRSIHEHPELSYKEVKTAALAAKELEEAGYTVKTGIARTGIVADIGKGKTVAIRADMDALPIDELGDCQFKSKTPGVMHACGHDAHVAMVLGAAHILAGQQLPGRARIIMQPAEEDVDEEGKSGGLKMAEADILGGTSSIIGLHCAPYLPFGKVGIKSGPLTAAADSFKLNIVGKGGHGAAPEKTCDPVVISLNVAQAINQIVSRRVSAHEAAVITIGSIQTSSTRANVIPDDVTLMGTIRTFDKSLREKLVDEVRRACEMSKVLGGNYSIEFEFGYPPVMNDPDVTRVVREAAVSIVGPENIVDLPHPVMFGEDFSFLSNIIPGSYFLLGTGIPNEEISLHTAGFKLDENVLHLGTAILAESALRLMR